MPVGKERVTEVIDYAMAHGDSRASEVYGLPISTLERYRRKYKEIYGEGADILLALKKRFTDTELKAMLSSSRIKPHEGKPISINENCEILRIGVLSDTHIGHKEFKQEYLYTAFDTMNARGCSMILHSGDVTEGLMNRPGHYYECDQYGYKAQRDEAIRVLSYWKKPIYISSGNHDCLTPEAECLTDSGWKAYTELTKSDKVYSYNPDTDRGEWHPITDILIREHDGEMVDISSSILGLRMTPNHRVLCATTLQGKKIKNGIRYSPYGYTEAHNLQTQTTSVYKMAAKTDRDEYPISDALLQTIAWIITDGSVKVAGNCVSYMIWQSKDISKICASLDEAGVEYKIHTRVRNITHICGKLLKKPPLPENRIAITAKGALKIAPFLSEKKMPYWMRLLSTRQFEIVSGVLKAANGSFNKISTGWALYGTREALEDFQILYLTNGHRATLRQDTRGAWKLNVCEKTTIELKKKMVTTSRYTGTVWCIQTPLTNFMVRYNGSAVFTGNCAINSKLGAGIDIVEDICDKIPNAHYLPGDPANITVNGIRFRLFHGRDRGGSYAKSYRPQKILDSFGTDIPEVLIVGHAHDADFCKYKGCYIIDAGSIQRETDFMRGNKLSADVGFWVVELHIQNGGIIACSPTWYDLEEIYNGE